MSEFRMPALGADMEAGTLVEWLVRPGDPVKSGEVIAIVETEKGAIEVEIFDTGRITEILVPVGRKVPVGTVLARLEGGVPMPAAAKAPVAQAATAGGERPAIAAVTRVPPPVAPVATALPAAPMPQARAKVTPAARRRAGELGLDPASLQGTGIDGAVTLADVEAAAAPPRAPIERPRRVGFDPAEMRKAIAAAMGRSKREIPHYYLAETVDLGTVVDWLEAFNRGRAPTERVLPAALLLKATALALREMPQLNGFYENGTFRASSAIHAGWAISLRGGGLAAPAILNTDRLPILELMAAMRDLVQRARTTRLRSSELTLPTVTVTSLGDRGAETVTGVIYPPQVAIVGFGRIATRPWVVGAAVIPRPLVCVTLAADHRASDGHVGGLLLNSISRLLQEPQRL